jgi:hypothetical protein
MNLRDEQEQMRLRQLSALSKMVVLYKERNPRRHGVRYWTYLIQGELTGLVKVGKSHNIVKRLRSHQVSSPDKLRLIGAVAGDYERSLHQAFAEYLVHGEWFKPEVINLVKARFDDFVEGVTFFPK